MTGALLAPEHAATADAMWARIRSAGRILIPTHINVDGDSLGSALGLGRALRGAGKEVVAVVSDGRVPHSLEFLMGDDAPLLFTGGAPPPTDLSLLVDITGPGRLGPLQPALGDRLDPAVTLNVDHHISNERFGSLNLIDPAAAATAELIFLLLRRWGLPVTAEIATPLMAGLMTDTISFQTTSTTPRAMRVAASLVETGAPQALLVERLFRAKPFSTARLFGAIVAAARLEDGLLWAEVTPAMLAACGAKASETEGAITYLSGVEEAIVFALLYQQEDGWRVSMRSNRDAVDVAAIAGRYGGGGHRRAAGCTVTGGKAARTAFLADVRATIAAGQIDMPSAGSSVYHDWIERK